jgi:hypothetical protein
MPKQSHDYNSLHRQKAVVDGVKDTHTTAEHGNYKMPFLVASSLTRMHTVPSIVVGLIFLK